MPMHVEQRDIYVTTLAERSRWPLIYLKHNTVKATRQRNDSFAENVNIPCEVSGHTLINITHSPLGLSFKHVFNW